MMFMKYRFIKYGIKSEINEDQILCNDLLDYEILTVYC